MDPKARLVGLDALRGLAALAVVFHHFTGRYGDVARCEFPVSFTFIYGNFGVQLFFIISGFVISLTLERTRGGVDFFASRFSRLWPAFVACMAVTLGVLAWDRPPWQSVPGIGTVLKNLTMAPEYFHGECVDGSYWSLAYEVLFYALAGACYYGLRARRTEVLGLFWMALAATLDRLSVVPIPLQIRMAFSVQYVPLFVIGVILYRLRQGDRSRLSFVVLILAVLLCSAREPWAIKPIGRIPYVAMVVGFAAIVWFATRERTPMAVVAPLVFLGDISYSVYLVHQQVGYVLIRRLTLLGLSPNQCLWIAVLSVILLGFAISKLVEKPGQRALRALFARFRSLPASGPPAEAFLAPPADPGARTD